MAMNPRLLVPRAAGGFDPQKIANLALWLDPTDPASYTEASGQISEWRDKSENGRDWEEATANNRPTLFESAADTQTATQAQINGRQAIFFDGANDKLTGNAAAEDIARDVPGITFFGVVLFPAAVTSRQDMFSIQRTSNVARFVVGTGTLARWNMFARREAESLLIVTSANNSITAGEPYVVSARVDYFTGAVLLRANGVSRITGTLNSTGGNSEDVDHLAANLGSFSASSYLSGLSGSMLAYQRALSDAEVQTVERGLGAAWGISVA